MLETFKIETFEDILRALRERPEWLEELRRIILTEELIALPQKFEKFRGEFKAFREEEFKPLKEKVDRIEQDVGVLKQDVGVLKQDVAVLKQDVAELKGDNFERKVRERAPSYFGRFIRRCRVISSEELADILDNAMDGNIISEEERDDALNIDVVATGVLKHDKERKVVVVTEVSIKADRSDVERAFERTKVIEKAMGLPALTVVIGREFTEGAETRAKELQVILC